MMGSLGADGTPDILELAGARYGERAEGPHDMIKVTESSGDIPEGRISDNAAAHFRGLHGDIEFKEQYGPQHQNFEQIGRHETMHSLLNEMGESGALMEIGAPGMEDVYRTMVDRGMWSGIKPFTVDPATGLPANYISPEKRKYLDDLHRYMEETREYIKTIPEWNQSGRADFEQQLIDTQNLIDANTPASMADMRDPVMARRIAEEDWNRRFGHLKNSDGSQKFPFEESDMAKENWAWKTPAGDRWTVEDLYNVQQWNRRQVDKPTGTREEDPVGWAKWDQYSAELPSEHYGGDPETGLFNWPMGHGHFFTLAQELENEGAYTEASKENIEKAMEAPKGSFVRALAETGVTSEALKAMRAYLMDNQWDKEGLRDFQESLDWYVENVGG